MAQSLTELFLEVNTREFPNPRRGMAEMREYSLGGRLPVLGDIARLYCSQFGHLGTSDRAVATGVLFPPEQRFITDDLMMTSGLLVDNQGQARMWAPPSGRVSIYNIRSFETEFAHATRPELYPVLTEQCEAAMSGLRMVLEALQQGELERVR